jgi:heat shock protein HtpX
VRGTLLVLRNVAKAWLLLGGLVGGLFALGWWLGGVRLGSLFFVVGLLMAATLYWYGPRVVLASLQARELPLAEAPVLYSTVERLAMSAAVERPRVFLLPGGHPRGLVVGRGASWSGIALSEGFIAGWLVEASRIGGWLERALLFVLGPVAASIVQVLLSPKRISAADTFAADVCGSPHGLADALIRLEQAEELVSFQGSPTTEPLYVVNPFEPVGLAAMFQTHPPVADRVQRLRALDPEWRDRLRAA